MTIVLTIIVSLVFLDVGDITVNPQQAYTNRVGLIFIIMANTTFASMNASAQAFLPLKIIFLKDKESNLYSRTVYFFASVFYIYPVLIPQQIISLILFYFITDLNKDSVAQFFWYVAFYLIGGFVNGSIIGIFAGVAVDQLKDIGAVIPILILPLFIVAGFFQSVKLMAWPLRILSYISNFRFTLQGEVLNEFSNRQLYLDSCKLAP